MHCFIIGLLQRYQLLFPQLYLQNQFFFFGFLSLQLTGMLDSLLLMVICLPPYRKVLRSML